MIERIFDINDQKMFARLSGDYNPLHTDPIRSRRLMFGEVVVHGIHLLLWALDHWIQTDNASGAINDLHATFNHPVRLGESIRVGIDSDGNGHTRLKVYSARATCVNIRLTSDPRSTAADHRDSITDAVPPVQEPKNLGANDLSVANGEMALYLPITEFKPEFPNVFELLTARQVAVLLASTRLVGMECPGDRSLYSELKVNFNMLDSDAKKIKYNVSSFDDRFSIATIDLNGAVKGVLKAFLRPDPVEQASFSEITRLVTHNEFDYQRALIVGGSRGIGEVTAKILAAGGAKVLATYHKGVLEAEKMMHQINSTRNTVEIVRCDITNIDESFTKKLIDFQPTHLYYFATPPIFVSVKGQFDRELFTKFCGFYLTGFIEIIEMILKSSAGTKHVLYPSSVAVEEIPPNMGEYAASKAAAEVMCDYLNKIHRRVHISRVRFPRLDTDQTSNVYGIQSSDTVQAALAAVRELCSNR